jgi:peptidoglycan-associated lipoprotein
VVDNGTATKPEEKPIGMDVKPPEPPPPTPIPTTESGIATTALDQFENMLMDVDSLKEQTVYFDFDDFTVKRTEVAKVEAIAADLKEKPENKLLIDGHCDERGTPEYNRGLGERRALSVRSQLVELGIRPERIRTRTWGFDRPADPGHNDAAYSKNRRAEFILLLPKQ